MLREAARSKARSAPGPLSPRAAWHAGRSACGPLGMLAAQPAGRSACGPISAAIRHAHTHSFTHLHIPCHWPSAHLARTCPFARARRSTCGKRPRPGASALGSAPSSLRRRTAEKGGGGAAACNGDATAQAELKGHSGRRTSFAPRRRTSRRAA